MGSDGKLLPCPFCGQLPSELRDGDLVTVACDNEDCAVQPEVFGSAFVPSAEVWNRRAPSPAPGREADTEEADETVKLVIEVLDAIRRDPKARKAVEAVLPAALKATIHERLNAALAREGARDE